MVWQVYSEYMWPGSQVFKSLAAAQPVQLNDSLKEARAVLHLHIQWLPPVWDKCLAFDAGGLHLGATIYPKQQVTTECAKTCPESLQPVIQLTPLPREKKRSMEQSRVLVHEVLGLAHLRQDGERSQTENQVSTILQNRGLHNNVLDEAYA